MSEHIEQATAAPGELRATRVHAGDTLVIEVPSGCTPAEAAELKRQFEERVPGVTVVILSGARVGAIVE